MTDDKEKERLMRQRDEQKKDFKRQNSHKHNRVPSSWRKARGKHSKVRLNKKHAKNSPNPGYQSPKAVRGLHPSGYEDILVHRPEDLDELNPDTEAARIASQVGGRKRQAILEKAAELDVKVLNHSQDGEKQNEE